MGYEKIVVDNLVCKRRFHLTFDSGGPTLPLAEVRCLHCDATVFSRKNHPAVKLARDENLVGTTSLSMLQATQCNFIKRNGKTEL